MRRTLSILIALLLGIVVGGYLFRESQPRSFLALHACHDQCFKIKDLAGLLASAGINHTPGLLPFLASESKRCVAVRHPKPEGRYHLVYLPKRDLRNVLELTAEDIPFLTDCLALAREDASRAGVRDYRLTTNGPGLQHVTYMHFHVVAK